MLFLYEPYDELVLMNLAEYDRKKLQSVESDLHDGEDSVGAGAEADADSLTNDDTECLRGWLKGVLLEKVQNIKVSLAAQCFQVAYQSARRPCGSVWPPITCGCSLSFWTTG